MDIPHGAAPGWRAVLATPHESGAAGEPLALGIEVRQRAAGGGGWQPRRLETASARSAFQRPGDLVVGVRPLMRSRATGAWVKGDASWDAVRRPGGPFIDAHAHWFAELHSIAREMRTVSTFADLTDWLTLDTVESRLIWPHLSSASAQGIPVVPTGTTRRVLLAAEAELAVRIVRGDDGALTLLVDAAIGDDDFTSPHLRPVGATGVYGIRASADAIDLALGPASLTADVRAVLASGAAVRIPATDAAEFLGAHYPRLARRVTVTGQGVQLPRLDPPVMLVQARYRTGDVVEITHAWSYPGIGTLALRESDTAGSDTAGPDTSGDRDRAREQAILRDAHAAWRDAGLAFTGHATLRGADAAAFSVQALPELRRLDGVRITTTGAVPEYREIAGEPRIRITTVESADPDWFDLGIEVTIDDRRIPFGALFTALSTRRTRMLLADGRYFSLTHPALERLRELIDEAADLVEWDAGFRLSRYHVAFWEEFEDLAHEAAPAREWRSALAALKNTSAPTRADSDAINAAAGLHADLRAYQGEGVAWLVTLWRHRLGGILADDMGLGKTVQALGLIAHATSVGEAAPFLVVAPSSVVAGWAEQAARFAPGLRVHVADVTAARSGIPPADVAADIVVTSYAVLRLDGARYAERRWAGVILDEAQYVKNPRTRVYAAVQGLDARAVFALTGTPFENGLAELHAILQLTSPGLFPSARRFRQEFIGPIERGQVPETAPGGDHRGSRLALLRRHIRPFVLRRTKEQVAADLPERTQQVLHVELAPAHRAIYDATLQRERQKILRLLVDLDRNRFIVFRSLTLLRMLSLSPALVDPTARAVSSKIDVLVERLVELTREGHRALVFSQFTSFLDLVEPRLRDAGLAFTRLDGSTASRARVVERFRVGDDPVFLLSLKAGGVGLTLTEADYVFVLDPWWNPAAEAQAVDRAHRIGQTSRVFVYRLIASGTIEEKVAALQERKQRVFTAVLDEGDPFTDGLDADDIRALLAD